MTECLRKYSHVLSDAGNSRGLTAQKCQRNWHKLNIQIWRCVLYYCVSQLYIVNEVCNSYKLFTDTQNKLLLLTTIRYMSSSLMITSSITVTIPSDVQME
jgi:hypothetical protein